MSKVNCEVIEDILPIYVENMARKESDEAVCIYEDKAAVNTDMTSGVIVLPRLTLNYYTLIAAMLSEWYSLSNPCTVYHGILDY